MRTLSGFWRSGTVEAGGELFDYKAKVYDEGSVHGIDGGRVSKLIVKGHSSDTWSRPLLSYDRGWDVEPRDSVAREALGAIIALYDGKAA